MSRKSQNKEGKSVAGEGERERERKKKKKVERKETIHSDQRVKENRMSGWSRSGGGGLRIQGPGT